eukprot:gene18756-biopygen6939
MDAVCELFGSLDELAPSVRVAGLCGGCTAAVHAAARSAAA